MNLQYEHDMEQRAFEEKMEREMEPATNMCPDCEGSGRDRANDCERCYGHGEVHE